MSQSSARVVSCVIAVLMFSAPLAVSGDTDAVSSTAVRQTDDGVVAYYFHGDYRCSTCRKIEAYSEEAIASGFKPELADHRLEWRVVNYDNKENKHFVKQFELVTRSVVLVEYHDGEVVRWKDLDEIWTLWFDKDDFVDYIQKETRSFLGEG